jgi:site-specific recombinase XerD
VDKGVGKSWYARLKGSSSKPIRHTLATGLIQSGVPTKTVSEILGHANVLITLNTYTHPVTENFRGPLKEMAAQLF